MSTGDMNNDFSTNFILKKECYQNQIYEIRKMAVLSLLFRDRKEFSMPGNRC